MNIEQIKAYKELGYQELQIPDNTYHYFLPTIVNACSRYPEGVITIIIELELLTQDKLVGVSEEAKIIVWSNKT